MTTIGGCYAPIGLPLRIGIRAYRMANVMLTWDSLLFGPLIVFIDSDPSSLSEFRSHLELTGNLLLDVLILRRNRY
jgi:hypothetical protein